MLKTLRINNYALINAAEIEFSPALNIITGETGAGKSILLGALGLLTGLRADTKVLFSKEKKCIVEGVFDIRNYKLENFFAQENIDFDNETIIRRELISSGKSRAFINDTPVTLQLLQQLADKLITIHSQHETLALTDSRFQLMVIDALANTQTLADAFEQDFTAWKKARKQRQDAEELAAKAALEKDFISFQFAELYTAGLDNVRQQDLEEELQQLTHAEEIKKNIAVSTEALEEAPMNISDQLRTVIAQLQAVVNFAPALQSYIERLQSAAIEMKDISRDISNMGDKISADPNRAEEINQQLSVVYKLMKKHNCKNTAALITLRNILDEKLQGLQNSEDAIAHLRRLEEKLYAALCLQAKKLSDKRMSAFPDIEKQVEKLLKEVGMPGAIFTIKHQFDTDALLGATGADAIQFLFSANKGSAAQDIKQVASGGELSRLMLCLKSLIAKSTSLPTLIFDEIDTGVSGETANKVGNILSQLAGQHQVISITHLPQIASKGRHHLYVYKHSDKNATQTHFKLLNDSERITEIAKMLSGEKPSASAMNNARELLSA
jgi:DNA repair protein RecN (Recombination protein N)